ncbi:MAG: CPBP family intramembrane metalloprotease [Eubacterium sp.]|nr:CPBP family intramembrane metalloprotease [Eubacterium sp.]
MTKRQKVWDVMFPLVFILLCMAAATIVLLLIAGLLTGEYDPNLIYERVRTLPMWISITTYSFTIVMQRQNYKVDSMRFPMAQGGWKPWRAAVACLFVTFAGHLWSTVITKSGLESIFTGYTRNAAAAFENQNLLLLVIGTVILGPIAEEMIFRGMLYRRAEYYTGRWMGALICALCFGIYHGNVIQFLYAFLLGFLLVWVYRKSGDLRVAVAAHMCVNAWAIFGDRIYSMLSGGKVPVFCYVAETVAAAVCFVLVRLPDKSLNSH